MIQITCYKKAGHLYRLRCEGHADYASYGTDIVCASVSMLVLNTLNALQAFTKEPIQTLAYKATGGLIDVVFPQRKLGHINPEAELLLKTLLLGIYDTKEMYGENYIQIIEK